MQTQSVIINAVMRLLSVLNRWYEHSILCRGVEKIKFAARGSAFLRLFTQAPTRNYHEGAWLSRLFLFFVSPVLFAIQHLANVISTANKSSINYKIYRYVITHWRTSFTGRAVVGCCIWRLVAWFFGERVALYKIVYLLFLAGVLIIPGFLWSNAFLLLSAIIFSGLFIWVWTINGSGSVSINRISPALILFVLFCALSIFTGYGGSDSLRVFLIFFGCVLHGILVMFTISNADETRLFTKLMAIALALTALFGFYQLAVGIPIHPEFTDLLANPGMTRLHSTMGNPNNDAQVWAMLLPFAIAAAIAVRCDVKRVLLVAAIVVCVAAFALTYSRAGYVALLAGLGVFVLMAAPRLVPLALILFIFAIPFIPSGIIERLLTLGSDTSSQYRFNIWRGVIDMLRIYWVQGIGMGPEAFAQVYRHHFHGEAWRALHAHNTFLDIIMHSGIGALITFLAFLLNNLKRGISTHMRIKNPEQRLYTAAAVASLVVFVAFGVGEYVWFYPRVMLVFWVCAGVLAGQRVWEVSNKKI